MDILVVFMLDFGQISFNLVKKAFATQQFALLASSIWARACTEIKILSLWTRNWPTSLGFSIFDFIFPFPFFYFSFLFAAVIGLLLGLLAVRKLLLAVKKLLRKQCSPSSSLRTFARKFSNIDFFWQFCHWKMTSQWCQKCKNNGRSPTSFWREHARKNTQIWVNRALLAKKATVTGSPKILQLELWREMFSAKYNLSGLVKFLKEQVRI